MFMNKSNFNKLFNVLNAESENHLEKNIMETDKYFCFLRK